MPAKKTRCTDGHRYRRFESEKGHEQWKCVDCPSYTYNRYDLVGNEARCYYCGTKFRITPGKLRYAALKCGETIEECKESIKAAISTDADMLSLYRQELEALAKERASDSEVLSESRSDSEQEFGKE